MKAVLIPVVKGTKRPAIDGWQKVNVERMNNPEYLRQLEAGNIGVVLGSSSNGLCTIDIDNDAAVEPFLQLNPALRRTLRTRGARGAQFWVRVSDQFPPLAKLKTVSGLEWGEWRADGGQSVIHGVHPSGREYQIVERAEPLEVSFGDLQWPGQLELPWVKSAFDLLVEAHGAPYHPSTKGGVALNQMFFVQKYILEHHILYDSSIGEFFQYQENTGLWSKQSEDSIKRRLTDDLTAVAKFTGEASLFAKRTDGLAAGLLAQLRSQVEQPDAFGGRPSAIHVQNGMICFDDDEVFLKSFHPDYLSRNACPFAFDPLAECPRFKKDLLESALEPADIMLLQRWAGAVLLGRNAAQRFLLFLGTPGGGKSTAMSILERTIGLQNVGQLRTEHLASQFELYGFVGRTLLTGKDVAADFLMKKSSYVIKSLVGHDLMEAEKKGFNERVQIRGDFNIGITCNADLNIRLEGDIGAWRRRLLVLKYERAAPTEKIPDFAEQLLHDEGPGILRWMVEGAIELLNDLKECGDYKLTDQQKRRVDNLLSQSESVRRFVMERVTHSLSDDVTTKELQAAYYDYCEGKGWHPLPPGSVMAQLPEHMLQLHRTSLRHDLQRDGKAARGYKHFTLAAEGF